MNNRTNGFTLIELLITISIIAILSAIGLVAYQTVMKQGRDSKRQSDLRSIQSALEQYYSDQHFYPACLHSSCGGTYVIESNSPFTSSMGNPFPTPPDPPKTYMNILPSDPINTREKYHYTYIGIGTGGSALQKYCLYANLENPPSSIPTPPADCTDSSYNFAAGPP